MDEILKITGKYDEAFIKEGLSSVEALNKFALTFYKDVVEIYDCITRITNIERNPRGFSLNDAPILGLLVRIWKLLKEVIRYYGENNAEIIGILERPLIEAAVVARYLMTSDQSIVEDYRRCSYKDRLRLLRNLQMGSAFYKTKAGQRLIKSVREKMDFEMQKKNRWKIQGKSFYDIFAAVEHVDLYAATYGMMSESIHGSWNESMDFCLNKNDDGTFSNYPS